MTIPAQFGIDDEDDELEPEDTGDSEAEMLRDLAVWGVFAFIFVVFAVWLFSLILGVPE